MSDRLGWVITALAAIGLLLSALSVHNHYKKEATDYCDFGATFNCDAVNKSAYSHIGPIPVAAIGVVGYVVLLLLSRVRREKRFISALLVLGALVGAGFSAWLTYIEARVLLSYCIICLGSFASILLIAILSLVRYVKTRELVF